MSSPQASLIEQRARILAMVQFTSRSDLQVTSLDEITTWRWSTWLAATSRQRPRTSGPQSDSEIPTPRHRAGDGINLDYCLEWGTSRAR